MVNVVNIMLNTSMLVIVSMLTLAFSTTEPHRAVSLAADLLETDLSGQVWRNLMFPKEMFVTI